MSGSREEAFLQAIAAAPEDLDRRLIFADWLEEQGDPRAELLRLLHTLTQNLIAPSRRAKAFRARQQQEARLRELLKSGVQPIGPFCTNSLGMTFALIPPGTFRMGSPSWEPERFAEETWHPVTLTHGFWMSIHPVTQRQWLSVMGVNPSHFKGRKAEFRSYPVDSVSWHDCREFCDRLGEKERSQYRLPTEAEWEYACRAGTTSPYFFGDTITTDLGNFNGSGIASRRGHGTDEPPPDPDGEDLACTWRSKPVVVGSFPPNAWGLYDMHGNIWEWCQDGESPYPSTAVVDPRGDEDSGGRIIRGGAWYVVPERVRSARRAGSMPETAGDVQGCRVVLGPATA